MSFLTAALKVAGTPFKASAHLASSGLHAVGNVAGKIPVVGTPLHTVLNVASGPFEVTEKIMKGGRIDKVIYNDLKRRIKDAQTLAPYAQTVVSLVPGVGTGVSGIIGAANALSKGKPIDAALMAGVRDSIPGGPAARAAFDVGAAALQGKSISEAALQAIPLPPEQKKYIIAGVHAVADAANGKRLDQAVIDRALNVAPGNVKKALQIGMAMQHGKNLQDSIKIGAAASIPMLGKTGLATIKADSRFRAGFKSLNSHSKRGFAAAIGALSHKASPTSLIALRASLHPEQRLGFDMGIAARIGATKSKHFHGKTPLLQFNSMVKKGMKAAKPATKAELRAALAHSMFTKHAVASHAAKHAQHPNTKSAAYAAAMSQASHSASQAAADAARHQGALHAETLRKAAETEKKNLEKELKLHWWQKLIEKFHLHKFHGDLTITINHAGHDVPLDAR